MASASTAGAKATDSAVDAGAPPELHGGLAWYADDAGAARAAARSQGKLVFVDLWADWCHTCLSMREFVLTSQNLAGVRDRLIFLAIDTEKAANEPLLRHLPIGAWPTFYVVDPELEIHGRWVGAASPAQLVRFVKDALASFDAAAGGTLAKGDPLALLVKGDRFAASGRVADAARSYRQALARAPADWPRRADALVALAASLKKLDKTAACVELGVSELASVGDSASATDFSSHVLACADSLPPGGAAATKLRKGVEARLDALCVEGSARLTPDDRADACSLLGELRQELGDRAGEERAVAQRLAVLEEAARGMPDRVAVTYDSARADALVRLGRGEEAIAMLEARERALPDDYNPPHFLARTYRDLGRFADGLEPVERALTKAQAPRRAAILGVKADLLFGLRMRVEAKRVLDEQLAAYRALPPGQRQPGREAAVERRIAAQR